MHKADIFHAPNQPGDDDRQMVIKINIIWATDKKKHTTEKSDVAKMA